MDTNLYLKIEAAENSHCDAEDLANVIVELTTHKATVNALIDAYRNAILNAEYMWREIEQTAAFQAKCTSRRDASIDYYRAASAVPKDE